MGNKKHPILISWIGGNDIKALAGEEQGPICATLKTISFQKVELLYSYPEELGNL